MTTTPTPQQRDRGPLGRGVSAIISPSSSASASVQTAALLELLRTVRIPAGLAKSAATTFRRIEAGETLDETDMANVQAMAGLFEAALEVQD